MVRITEKELILPSLYLMEKNQNIEITTPFLIENLTNILQPNEIDMQIIKGRKDSYFSQKVRNLNSHDTLRNPDYAYYTKTGHNKGYFTITALGKKYLNDSLPFLEYISSNNFSFNDKKEALKRIYKKQIKIEIFDEDIMIQEGKSILKTSKIYSRSSKLRNIAIEHFTKNNKIICEACCFDFENFYGEHGKSKTIDMALKNLIPVCSNCHRMIHRKKEYPLEIEAIKEKINHSLSFCK